MVTFQVNFRVEYNHVMSQMKGLNIKCMSLICTCIFEFLNIWRIHLNGETLKVSLHFRPVGERIVPEPEISQNQQIEGKAKRDGLQKIDFFLPIVADTCSS